jgi:hypothetical protein
MAYRTAPEITPRLRRSCRLLVYKAAERYQVPPCYITAHTRMMAADQARKWVMVQMLVRLHMKRWQVAMAFGRDLRRVRKSVLGA